MECVWCMAVRCVYGCECGLCQWCVSSCSVLSNSLQPHGLQHARLPCPSPSPRVCSKIDIHILIYCILAVSKIREEFFFGFGHAPMQVES